MATAVIVFEDDDRTGEVGCKFNFSPSGLDEQSAAHALAVDVIKMIGDMKRAARGDDGEDA